jgi:hypothetical protein
MPAEYASRQPMPAEATRNLFLWASGFGVGALLVLGGFVFLVGIGAVGHDASQTPAAQSAASAPAAPGQGTAPQASRPAGTTGQASQPAHSGTAPQPRQPETTGQAPKSEAPAQPQVPKPGGNRS